MNNLEEINKFYTLKKKYDNKYRKNKQIILNKNNQTLTQKKELIKKLKRYCVNCGKEGGTNFTITNTFLSASCNATTKCKLNMNINKEINYNIKDEYYKINKQFNQLKIKLMQIKNDTIEKLITSGDAVELFLNYKEEYSNLDNKRNILLEKYNNIINNTFNINKISNLTKILDSQINEIKFNIKKYNDSNNNEYIKNVVNIYTNVIDKINNDIKMIKYVYYNIECQDVSDLSCKNNNYKLIADTYNIETLYQTNIYS